MNVLWGGAFVVAKWGLSDVSPLTMAFLRFFLGGLCLMPFCLHQWRNLERGDWWRLIWVCFLGVAVANAFLYEGIHRTTAMKASLETALEPVFLALMAVVFLHEGFSRRLLGALVLSLAGSFLLVVAGQPQE